MNPPPSKLHTDCHFHVFAPGVGVPGARYVPDYAAPLHAWQDAATACGVRRGVLVQTSFLGTDNSVLLDQLRRHPDLLRGIAVVAPGAAAAELAPLHADGVRGIRLNLAGQPGALEAWRSAHRLWDALQGLGWHVELHTDQGALPATLAALPADLPVVVDHMAKPDAASLRDASVIALVQRAQRAPVHLKLSGAYRLGGVDPAALARLWLGELGAARLVWGSDWPCTNHEAMAHYPSLLAALHDWVGEDAAQQVLVETPQALYWRR